MKHFRRIDILRIGTAWLALYAATPSITSIVATAWAAPNVSCSKLQISLSNDKNYYSFTARATGDTDAVTGYTFTFGDHQSYTVKLASSTSDHSTATVTHTYLTAGTFTARAQALVKDGRKTNKITSDSCHTTVTIGNPVTTMPNAGASPTAMLAIACAAVLLATAAWEFRLRARFRGQN